MAMPELLQYIDLELEFLLTFLVITERRIIRVEEKAIDLFGDHDMSGEVAYFPNSRRKLLLSC